MCAPPPPSFSRVLKSAAEAGLTWASLLGPFDSPAGAVGKLRSPASGSVLVVCWPDLVLCQAALRSLKLVQVFLCGDRSLRKAENTYRQFTALPRGDSAHI